MSSTRFITVKEAAEILNCTPHYIRKLLREDRIKGGKIGGSKHLHVDPESLEQFKKTEDYTRDLKQLKQEIPITIMDAVTDVEENFKTDLVAYVATIGAPASNIVHDDCIILDDILNNLEPEYPGQDGKKFNKITLFLQSGGGVLDAAIKFVNIIQHYANHFDVIVPMMAKSAASLISLSAENIYMTPVSELGPIDPVVQSPSNPGIQVPARAIDDLIKAYSKEQGSQKTNAGQVERILLKKIEDLDPYLLGSYKSALAYSQTEIQARLKTKIKDPTLLDMAVREFTEDHESHSFPITLGTLQKYGIGNLVKDQASISSVKTLLAVYQAFMAANSIVKTVGNRNMNRNVVLQAMNRTQVPTKTSI